MVIDVLVWAAIVVALFGIICTLLPIIPTTLWWIRDMDFPRVQLTVLLACAIVPLLLFGRDETWKIAVGVVAILCALYQVVKIFPYTSLHDTQSKMATRDDRDLHVRIMNSNVLMSNRNAAGLFHIIDDVDPDIFLALETDQWWTDEIKHELAKSHPYQIAQPLDNTYGIILCSRYELIDPRVHYFVEDTIPSIITQVKLPSGDIVDLYCIHPRPPLPGEDTEERDAELLVVAKMVKEMGRPAIVFGDLNDVAWSHTTHLFQKISGMLDPRIGRGTYSTFHADHFFLRYPLDHIFHTREFRLVMLQRLPAYGSDHFPITAELSYEPEKKHHQEKPEAEPEEYEEAEEKIEEGVEEGRMEGED